MDGKKNLILASASPRRHELLSHIWNNFQILPSNAPEIFNENNNPNEIVTDLALLKANDIYKKHSNESSFIIGADTIVVYENKILGKPKDIDQAREMLILLSGQEHYVYTGVAFVWQHKGQIQTHSFFEKTLVEFEKIHKSVLNHYLETKDSLDKAGSYGIQGPSLSFIKRIEGSYSNVVGFPLNRVLLEVERILNSDFFDIFN